MARLFPISFFQRFCQSYVDVITEAQGMFDLVDANWNDPLDKIDGLARWKRWGNAARHEHKPRDSLHRDVK